MILFTSPKYPIRNSINPTKQNNIIKKTAQNVVKIIIVFFLFNLL